MENVNNKYEQREHEKNRKEIEGLELSIKLMECNNIKEVLKLLRNTPFTISRTMYSDWPITQKRKRKKEAVFELTTDDMARSIESEFPRCLKYTGYEFQANSEDLSSDDVQTKMKISKRGTFFEKFSVWLPTMSDFLDLDSVIKYQMALVHLKRSNISRDGARIFKNNRIDRYKHRIRELKLISDPETRRIEEERLEAKKQEQDKREREKAEAEAKQRAELEEKRKVEAGVEAKKAAEYAARISRLAKLEFSPSDGKIVSTEFIQQKNGWVVQIIMDNGKWSNGLGSKRAEALVDAKGRIIEKDYDHNDYEDYSKVREQQLADQRHAEALAKLEEIEEEKRQRHEEMLEEQRQAREEEVERQAEMLEEQRQSRKEEAERHAERRESRGNDDNKDKRTSESGGEREPRVISMEHRRGDFRPGHWGLADRPTYSILSDRWTAIAKVEMDNGDWSFGYGFSEQKAIKDAKERIKNNDTSVYYYDADDEEMKSDF